MLVITKITNNKEKYTTVNAFSSFELASKFMNEYVNSCTNDELRYHYFSTERVELDKPDYPFSKV